MYILGIDIGSRNTKILILDQETRKPIYSSFEATAVDVISGVRVMITKALYDLDITSDLMSKTCVTGYGRKLYQQADFIKSEISCHTAGCLYSLPLTRTIIDIGGQDSKIICLDDNHKVKEFLMNDKCAAGTGRFLEMTASRLECSISELPILAAKSDIELALNSTCVVFAESEIIGLLSSGRSPSNIARAVHMSIARRIYAQMASISWEPPVVFTGGVAQNRDIAYCLSLLLNTQVIMPPDPEITGALGAALLAQ